MSVVWPPRTYLGARPLSVPAAHGSVNLGVGLQDTPTFRTARTEKKLVRQTLSAVSEQAMALNGPSVPHVETCSLAGLVYHLHTLLPEKVFEAFDSFKQLRELVAGCETSLVFVFFLQGTSRASVCFQRSLL